jgi:hypothetical protein
MSEIKVSTVCVSVCVCVQVVHVGADNCTVAVRCTVYLHIILYRNTALRHTSLNCMGHTAPNYFEAF